MGTVEKCPNTEIAESGLSHPGQGEQGRTLFIAGKTPAGNGYLDTLHDAGYVIEKAEESGKLLIEKISQRIPHVLLLDMDGLKDQVFDLTEQLKSNPMTYTNPVTIILGDHNTGQEIAALRCGAEDYVAKPFDSEVLRARIDTILRRHFRLQVSNPLTGLPGNLYIEEQITKRIENSSPLAVCYTDLDNFKAFNDKYGYVRGDNVLRILAGILTEANAMFGGPNDFVGHIGGDDFIVVCDYDRVDNICTYVTETFDMLIPYQYDDEDRERGYVDAKNRLRQMVRFPIMTVSIGVVTNDRRQLNSFLEISELSAEMKAFAKSYSLSGDKIQSSYRVDKRTDR